MRQVVVDGEAVVFEGEAPESPSEIHELLMNALSEQGRVVVSFAIDGNNSFPDDQFPGEYEKIEASSLTHDELTLRLIIESMNQLSETENQLDAYIRNILSVSWSEVFNRMNELVGKVQPFAELIDNLGPYVSAYEPPWGDRFKEISFEQADSLTGILDAFEQGNPAKLSDDLSIRFIPVFKRSRKLFSEEIIPYLKRRVEKA
jgi:hypothetical protein